MEVLNKAKFGRRLPLKSVSYLTSPKMKLSRVFLSLALILLCAIYANAQVSSTFGERSIAPMGEHSHPNAPIRAAVIVGGRERVFIVDTGASRNFLENQLKSVCSNPLGMRKVNAGHRKVDLPIYGTARARIGSQSLDLGPVGILDLDGLSSVFGEHISGVLGLPFLADTPLGYQEANETFYMGMSYVRHFDATYKLRSMEGYISTSDVDIGIAVDGFMLDTGMNSPISLSEERFNEAAAQDLITDISRSRFVSANGQHESRTGFLKALSAWDHKFSNVPVVEGSREAIGLTLIRKFDFRIICRNRTIEISSNKYTKQPFSWDRSGISLQSVENKLLIIEVDKGSPSEIAGIKKQDEIIEINDKAADSSWYGLSDARAALSDPGSCRIKLLIRRDGKLGEYVFDLRATRHLSGSIP